MLEPIAGRYQKVVGQHREWVAYLNREDVRGMWDLQPAEAATATCSVACVLKSNGRDLRKLMQCVPFNTLLLALTLRRAGI